MNLNATIGSKIALLRKAHNMTQEQLAEKLDISIKHCSSVERGLACLSLTKLVEVSILFDVSLDFLVKSKPLSIPYSTDYICNMLPPSVINAILVGDEKELNLFIEYISLYTKLRNKH